MSDPETAVGAAVFDRFRAGARSRWPGPWQVRDAATLTASSVACTHACLASRGIHRARSVNRCPDGLGLATGYPGVRPGTQTRADRVPTRATGYPDARRPGTQACDRVPRRAPTGYPGVRPGTQTRA